MYFIGLDEVDFVPPRDSGVLDWEEGSEPPGLRGDTSGFPRSHIVLGPLYKTKSDLPNT